MITFNLLLIVNLRKKFNKKKDYSSKSSKIASSSSSNKTLGLTISLITVSFLFMIMTTPGTILFAYFYGPLFSKLDRAIVYLIDDISYLNHSMLFFISFVSNKKFRKTIIRFCLRPKEELKQISMITFSNKS